MDPNRHRQALDILEIEYAALMEMVCDKQQCISIRAGRGVCNYRCCGIGKQCARKVRRAFYDFMDQMNARFDLEQEDLAQTYDAIILSFLATDNCSKAMDGIGKLTEMLRNHIRMTDASAMDCCPA